MGDRDRSFVPNFRSAILVHCDVLEMVVHGVHVRGSTRRLDPLRNIENYGDVVAIGHGDVDLLVVWDFTEVSSFSAQRIST